MSPGVRTWNWVWDGAGRAGCPGGSNCFFGVNSDGFGTESQGKRTAVEFDGIDDRAA